MGNEFFINAVRVCGYGEGGGGGEELVCVCALFLGGERKQVQKCRRQTVCVCVQIVEAREAANRLHLMISDNEQKQSSTLK